MSSTSPVKASPGVSGQCLARSDVLRTTWLLHGRAVFASAVTEEEWASGHDEAPAGRRGWDQRVPDESRAAVSRQVPGAAGGRDEARGRGRPEGGDPQN